MLVPVVLRVNTSFMKNSNKTVTFEKSQTKVFEMVLRVKKTCLGFEVYNLLLGKINVASGKNVVFCNFRVEENNKTSPGTLALLFHVKGLTLGQTFQIWSRSDTAK